MTRQTAPIGWFEIAGSDPARTEAFYSTLFDWSYTDSPIGPSYRIVDAGDGVAGGVTTAAPGLPETYAIFSVIVPDVAAVCSQVVGLGGRVLVGPELTPDGLAFANLEDPDGNHFGVFCPPAPASA